MSDHVERAQLPPSELGEDRCFEIGYFGHGDIIVASWQGSLDHDPRNGDGISTRFGFTHGKDSLILAAMSGFLIRAGRTKTEVGQILLEAGENVLADGTDGLRYHDRLNAGYLSMTAQGSPATRYDEKELGLECLVTPTPSQPGVIDRTGGSAIYTRRDEERQRVLLVFGRIEVVKAVNGERKTVLGDTAEFGEPDIPVMAQLVCKLALGEYRRDVHAFLVREFTDEEVEF